VEPRRFHLPDTSRCHSFTFDLRGEDRVRSATGWVHGRWAYFPIGSASCHDSSHVFVTGHDLFLQAFNVDSFLHVFSNVQIEGQRLKQIHNLFVVYFQVAALNQVLHLFPISLSICLLLLHAFEYVFKRPLHESSLLKFFRVRQGVLHTNDSILAIFSDSNWTLNCVCLTSASLSISKYRSIISSKTAVCDRLSDVVKYLLLGYLITGDIVECVGF
jgi:hypothetical protein